MDRMVSTVGRAAGVAIGVGLLAHTAKNVARTTSPRRRNVKRKTSRKRR